MVLVSREPCRRFQLTRARTARLAEAPGIKSRECLIVSRLILILVSVEFWASHLLTRTTANQRSQPPKKQVPELHNQRVEICPARPETAQAQIKADTNRPKTTKPSRKRIPNSDRENRSFSFSRKESGQLHCCGISKKKNCTAAATPRRKFLSKNSERKLFYL